jgi:hypothetical protein
MHEETGEGWGDIVDGRWEMVRGIGGMECFEAMAEARHWCN